MTCLTDFLTDIATNAAARDHYLADPETAMAAAGLSAEDKDALLHGKAGIRQHVACEREPKGFIWSNSLEADQAGFIWANQIEADMKGFIWSNNLEADVKGIMFGTCINENGLDARH